MARIARMTSVQPIFSTHDDIVADIVDLVVISLSWLYVEVFEVEIPARLSLGAVKPDNPVVCRSSGDVFERDVVPFEQAGVFTLVLLVEQVGQAFRSALHYLVNQV